MKYRSIFTQCALIMGLFCFKTSLNMELPTQNNPVYVRLINNTDKSCFLYTEDGKPCPAIVQTNSESEHQVHEGYWVDSPGSIKKQLTFCIKDTNTTQLLSKVKIQKSNNKAYALLFLDVGLGNLVSTKQADQKIVFKDDTAFQVDVTLHKKAKDCDIKLATGTSKA